MKRAPGSRFGSALYSPSTSDSSTRQSAPVICATRAAREERFEGGARVQVAAAALAVLESEQHLRHGHIAPLEQLLVGMRESDLSHRSGGLTLLQPQRAVLEPEPAPAERNGARCHQDD